MLHSVKQSEFSGFVHAIEFQQIYCTLQYAINSILLHCIFIALHIYCNSPANAHLSRGFESKTYTAKFGMQIEKPHLYHVEELLIPHLSLCR